MNYLQPSELLSVLKIARAESLRDWLLICFQFNHALRPAEVCAIKLEDIRDGQLTVQRRKGSRLTTQPVRKHRGEPLLDEARGLSDWLKVRPLDSGSALFTSAKGGNLTPKSYHRLFQKYALLAGLPKSKAHPHIVRHSSITALIRQGVDISWAQVHAGHASIGSTVIYIHLADSEVSEKADNAFIDAFKERATP